MSNRYKRSLKVTLGCCLYCRAEGESSVMRLGYSCGGIPVSRLKRRPLVCMREGKECMAKLIVCWRGSHSQLICQVANVEVDRPGCQLLNMMIPLCYRAWSGVGERRSLRSTLGSYSARSEIICSDLEFSEQAFLNWLDPPPLIYSHNTPTD